VVSERRHEEPISLNIHAEMIDPAFHAGEIDVLRQLQRLGTLYVETSGKKHGGCDGNPTMEAVHIRPLRFCKYSSG